MNELKHIVNLATGNIDPEDRKEVLQKLKATEEDKEIYRKAKTAWTLLSSTRKRRDYDLEKSYILLHQRISEDKRSSGFRMGTFLKYAAIVVILIGLPVLLFFSKDMLFSETASELKYTSVVADAGQISKIILPDSSVVWLNSGTSLSYNNEFSLNNRDLYLKGQAYLQVTKNKNLPLIVSCNDLKVKVLGTHFDVNAYPESKNTEVILESGSVELLQEGNDAFSYRLRPGEKARYNKQLKEVQISKFEHPYSSHWREGYLIFSDTPMSEVIKKLERRFDVEIIVRNSEVDKSIFNAKFKDETLEEILNYIQYSCPIKYKILNNPDNKMQIELYAKSDKT
ncbi:MAG: FecR family protein [Draconibacterium sp.]